MAQRVASAEAFVLHKMRYQVQDRALLIEALDTTGLRIRQSNQRLALLGDAALKLALLDEWYPAATPKGKIVPLL